ncbi:MAG: class I mannose-6-phosphate isomerase [Sphingosinicella sp.]
MKLHRRFVEKPWGRTKLPPMFAAPADKRIGEVWFMGGTELPLLAKYIFTAERLSIQVHPNDEQARARGFDCGKTECWYILEAEPGATLGLGLKRELSADELREAALDGSIEGLLDWQVVTAGDFYLVPAGTIHAIGGGVSLLEFQQNSDLTYRLFDYGRPRELHLDEAVAVANRAKYPEAFAQHVAGDAPRTLVDGAHFTFIYSHQDALQDRQRWVIPLEGEVRSGRDVALPGECLLLDAQERLSCDNARLLVGASPRPS